MRRLLIVLVLVLATALTVGFAKRRTLAPRLVALLVERPEPKAPPPLDRGVAWNGEWYTVQHLDEATIAIGEPRSEGRNVSYLLLGSARAVLFDAGEGWADLSPVVDDLADLPVIVIPSHLHYDHLGSIENFSAIALPDLPALRAQAPDGVLVPTFHQFLGVVVDRDPPALHVAEWWKPDEPVDLGEREVVVRHTPGQRCQIGSPGSAVPIGVRRRKDLLGGSASSYFHLLAELIAPVAWMREETGRKKVKARDITSRAFWHGAEIV
jgi:hypothetical protein